MKCEHCKLNFKQEQMREKNGLFFCCKGCESVYEILQDNDLNEFYQRLGNQSLKLVNLSKEFKNYDEFVHMSQDGFSETHLLIHGIECTTCIWLNKKILIRQKDILEFEINQLNHKARIAFNQKEISLGEISALIESVSYKASAYDVSKNEKRAERLKREFYSKMIVAIACVMNIMWIAMAKYTGFFSGMERDIRDTLNFFELVLAIPVLFYTGSSSYKNAFKALKYENLNMDTLVINGASLAYIYPLWAMLFRVGEVYFGSVAMIICFVFVGKYLEVFSKKRALDTTDGLNDFLQNEILVFNGNEFKPKEVQEVELGDIILLRAGDKILINGICVKGEGSIDRSPLNGENVPQFIQKGNVLQSACVLMDGNIECKAIKLYKDSTLSKIIKLLEFAGSKKTKLANLINQISGYFSRTILTLTLLCFCFWFFYFSESVEKSFISAISVLIIACPCVLALATPVSNLIASSKAFRYHIFSKDSSMIGNLSKCDFAVFDKTGILTKAELQVEQSYLNEKLDTNEFYTFLSLLKYPIAKSVEEFLRQRGAKKPNLDLKELQNINARGLKTNLNGEPFLGGNEVFLRENHIRIGKKIENSHFLFAKNNEILASFELESILREGAKDLIAYLQKEKKQAAILSGDNEFSVQKIANQLGISNYKASCSPKDKMKELEKLSQHHKVLFVSDGINDALALKFAAVAITLREGSDLAIENNDILLLKNDLKSLQTAFELSQSTFKIIKQNLAFSFFYNALSLSLAFLGLANPLIAALSMSPSSTIVVLNALRIKK